MPAHLRVLTLSFVAGACVMAAELAAPRLVAPHLGTGLLTWTAVIATFLGGIALGNAWGGRRADRAGAQLLPALFVFAGIAVAAAVALYDVATAWFGGLPHGLRVPASVVFTFLPAAFVLGTTAPFLARAALATGTRPGRALGAVAAAGAIGSVAGTLLTGFWLVPRFGTGVIHLAVASLLVLAAVGAAVIPATRRETRGPEEAPAPPGIPRVWVVLAALAGAALLVVEIVAGRVAAAHLGSSLYSWTSVIAVVLVGLSVGNTVGGRLADRHEPRRLLGILLLVASVAVATGLWTPAVMRAVAAGGGPWMLRVLMAVAAGFLVPSVVIGTLSPVVIRAALGDPRVDGRVVGSLYAIGTMGAVAAALLTTYLLIPLLQVPLLLVLLALGLALASHRLRGHREVPWVATLVVLAFLTRLPWEPARDLGLALGIREDAPGSYVRDSRYFHIAVHPYDERWVRLEEPPDLRAIETQSILRGRARYDAERGRLIWRGPLAMDQYEALRDRVLTEKDVRAVHRLRKRARHRVRYLSLDRLVHGFVDLDDPLWLEYDYERLYAAVVERLWPSGVAPVRCYFIGGGTYTFQRRLLTRRGDDVELLTVEIDPAVTDAAREALGLADDARHQIVHEDARTHLRSWTGAPFDLVFGDAFHDVAVPWHLTTRECAEAIREHLRERSPIRRSGVYLLNVVDIFDEGRFLGAMLGTLEAVFEHVALLSMGPREDGSQDTFILVASDDALSLAGLGDDAGQPLPVVRYGPEDLERLRGRAKGLVLTDDFAPVEALLAPVVRIRGARGEQRGR